ncbi:MAG: hypothetical protein IT460_11005 [Planctomycetes bacterium]|nr:hypothetical protein [Planctomycetota bacterium]
MDARLPAVPEDPKVCAMLLCDHAHRDPSTGKFSLLGIFDRIHAKTFPATHGPFAIYLNLTNMHGAYNLAVQVLRADDESKVGETRAAQALTVRDPLSRVEMALHLPGGLPLAKAGGYVFRLTANDRPLQDLVCSIFGPSSGPEA